jgi:hypothetical protein
MILDMVEKFKLSLEAAYLELVGHKGQEEA